MRARLYAEDGNLLLEADLGSTAVCGRHVSLADKLVLVLDDPGVERRRMREPMFLSGRLVRA